MNKLSLSPKPQAWRIVRREPIFRSSFISSPRKRDPGDQILISLSGNGSRQPVQNHPNPADSEQDILHSTFWPADALMRDNKHQVVERAIVDDELNIWIKSILDKAASVCLIIDACNSDLGEIPEAEGFVGLFATQPDGTTLELRMPSNDPEGQYHGLFTWTLCEVLTQANTPLTYTQLIRRVRDRYAARGPSSPTPRVIGKERQAFVLGGTRWSGRAQILLMPASQGGFLVNAGSLLGLNPGMVLEVRPPIGHRPPETIIGHVRVTKEIDAYSARALPCSYEGMPVVEDLPPAGGCRPVFFDFGDMNLKVSVSKRDRAGVLVPESVRERLLRELSAMATRDDESFTVANEDRDADWLVQVDAITSRAAYLINTATLDPEKSRGLVRPIPPGIFGPFSTEQLPEGLGLLLGRITRSRNLLRIADLSARMEDWGGKSQDLVLNGIKFRDGSDRTGQVIELNENDRHLGPIEGIRIQNLGSVAFDVMPLMLEGSSHRIKRFPPAPGNTTYYRVSARSSLTINLPSDDAIDLTTAPDTFPFGSPVKESNYISNNNIIVFVFETEAPPADWSWLTEQTFAQARSLAVAHEGARRTFDSPLGRLMQHVLYAEGDVKGLPLSTFSRFSLGRISFDKTHQPLKAPANPLR